MRTMRLVGGALHGQSVTFDGRGVTAPLLMPDGSIWRDVYAVRSAGGRAWLGWNGRFTRSARNRRKARRAVNKFMDAIGSVLAEEAAANMTDEERRTLSSFFASALNANGPASTTRQPAADARSAGATPSPTDAPSE